MKRGKQDLCNKKNFTVINIEKVKVEKNDRNPVKQQSNIYRNIRLYFREYCLNSSLHGIRYLGEKGRTKTERLWWLLFFIACIFMCSQLIKKIWMKWDSMPVIIGFAEKPTLIWQVPFPAVTICSDTKFRHSIYNYTSAYHKKVINMTEEADNSFLYTTLICDQLFDYEQETVNQSAIDFIRKVAPQYEDLFWLKLWSGEYLDNKTYITESITEEGLCYTFNMLDGKEIFKKGVKKAFHIGPGISSDWSLNKGYKKSSSTDLYPKRIFRKGTGLTIALGTNNQDFNYICKGPSQGFKIIFHNPEELPRINHHHTVIASWNQVIEIKLQPDIMTASKELEGYHPSRRNCFYADERFLRYFKTYTQSNCEIECLTNYTLKRCDCSAFYMPYYKNTSFCGPAKYDCVQYVKKLLEQNAPINYMIILKKTLPRFIWTNKWVKNFVTPFLIPVSDEFILKELSDDLEELYENKEDINIHLEKCNCLPGCTSLEYNAETVEVQYNLDKMLKDMSANVQELEGAQISRINIYFKDTQFMTWRRSELYDQTDFLANCGGLLGLFLGFSVLSLVEIVYFLTLRLYCNIKMHVLRLWIAIKLMYL